MTTPKNRTPRTQRKPLNKALEQQFLLGQPVEPELAPAQNAVASTNTIPIDHISLPQSQPRKYFDAQRMQQLVESVKRDGILTPLLVRPVGDSYELVAGERRYRAARAAGLTEVPVTVKEMTDIEATQFALVENLQREDLNPIEETEGILHLLAITLNCPVTEVQTLLNRMQNSVAGRVTHNVMDSDRAQVVVSVFARLGQMTWESFAKNRLPLLKLPDDIKDALRSGRIEYTKALAISRVDSVSERQQLLEDASALGLSLSQIRERVKASLPAKDRGELQSRFDTTTKQIKKSSVWSDPKKREKLESLLAEMEALMAESD